MKNVIYSMALASHLLSASVFAAPIDDFKAEVSKLSLSMRERGSNALIYAQEAFDTKNPEVVKKTFSGLNVRGDWEAYRETHQLCTAIEKFLYTEKFMPAIQAKGLKSEDCTLWLAIRATLQGTFGEITQAFGEHSKQQGVSPKQQMICSVQEAFDKNQPEVAQNAFVGILKTAIASQQLTNDNALATIQQFWKGINAHLQEKLDPIQQATQASLKTTENVPAMATSDAYKRNSEAFTRWKNIQQALKKASKELEEGLK